MNTSGFQIQLFAQYPGSPVNWRLLSGNNRESGRGATGHPDAEACLRSIAALQAGLQRFAPRTRRVDPNRWLWELHADGAPVAVAGHAFDRLIRCEQALGHFMAQFAGAPVRPGIVVSGARRWGTVAS